MEYDVALSFAGENRKYVKEVANELKKLNVRVFYDDFETVNLWGKDLYTHLQDIYQNQAKYTVIFISEQYSQFTAIEWLKVLQEKNIQISMDGRGRCFDNIFVERLWRTVKQEEVYLKEYSDVWEAEESLRKYFEFYNYERAHQSLGYQTPAEIYQKGLKIKENKGAKTSNF